MCLHAYTVFFFFIYTEPFFSYVLTLLELVVHKRDYKNEQNCVFLCVSVNVKSTISTQLNLKAKGGVVCFVANFLYSGFTLDRHHTQTLLSYTNGGLFVHLSNDITVITRERRSAHTAAV